MWATARLVAFLAVATAAAFPAAAGAAVRALWVAPEALAAGT